MEKKFSGKIWKFGNDIDTDTIIPGKRGTIPDRNEMKKYAFEAVKTGIWLNSPAGRHPGGRNQLWLWFQP